MRYKASQLKEKWKKKAGSFDISVFSKLHTNNNRIGSYRSNSNFSFDHLGLDNFISPSPGLERELPYDLPSDFGAELALANFDHRDEKGGNRSGACGNDWVHLDTGSLKRALDHTVREMVVIYIACIGWNGFWMDNWHIGSSLVYLLLV